MLTKVATHVTQWLVGTLGTKIMLHGSKLNVSCKVPKLDKEFIRCHAIVYSLKFTYIGPTLVVFYYVGAIQHNM